MLFDTHCHLNFQAFDNNLEDVIDRARKAGVNNIIIPGTDVETSKKAIEIAEKYEGIYAAVGIHPHHIYQYQISKIKDQKYILNIKNDLKEIKKLLKNNKVVAVGEVGVDRHYYQKTKHENYKVNQEFIDLQKEFFIEQIKLAHQYKKALIIHNRKAKKDILNILATHYELLPTYSSVFHCCEPDQDLLDFAIEHKMFIGVDGDVTYWKEKLFGFAQSKQEFIKKVPLNMLVLETDSPLLIPELSGSRSWTRYNEPKNIVLIAEFVAKLKNVSINQLIDTTTENARMLFKVSPFKD